MKQDTSIAVEINDSSASAALGEAFGQSFMLPFAAAKEGCVVSVCAPNWCGNSNLMGTAVRQAVPDYDFMKARRNRDFYSLPQGIFGDNQPLSYVDLGRKTNPLVFHHHKRHHSFREAIASDYGFAKNKQHLTRGIVVADHPSAPIATESAAVMLMGNPSYPRSVKIYFEEMAGAYLDHAEDLAAQQGKASPEATKLHDVAEHMYGLMRRIFQASSRESTVRIAHFLLLSDKPEARDRFNDFRQRVVGLGLASISQYAAQL